MGTRKRVLINLVTVAVTLLFCYFALSGVHLGRAWHALRTSEYVWLLPALVALALSLLARALRWQALFAPGRRPPFGSVFVSMMIGYLFNNILPARAGEVARIVVLNQRTSAEPVEIVGTVVLERVFDVLGILLIFFVAEPWLPSVGWFHAAAIAAGVLVLAIAGCAVALAVYGERGLWLLLRPLRRLPFISSERLERAVKELTYGLSALRYPRVAMLGLFWTVVAWMLTAALAYFVSLAFYPNLPFAAGMLVTVAVGLAMILPAPPAAVGVFEGAALIGLEPYGLTHTQALPYALVLHVVNFLPFIVLGFFLLQYNTRHPVAGRPAPASEPARAGVRAPSPAGTAAAPADETPRLLAPRPAVDWAAGGSDGDGLWHQLPAAQQATAMQDQPANGAERL